MSESDVARRALGEGNALLELGRTDEAIARLSAAVASDPEDAEAQCSLALALAQAGRSREALETATVAAALAPESDWPQRLRAIALLQLGRAKEALVPAEDAVRLEPELAECHEVHADALVANKQYDAAIEAAGRAVNLNPEDPGPWETIGSAHLEKKQWFLAVNAYRAALERDPENAMAHNNLGIAYLRNDEPDAARECFERAVRIDPSRQLFRDNLALTSRAHVNGGWILIAVAVVVWIGGRGVLRESDVDVAAGVLAMVILLAVILAVWAIGARRRMRETSAGVQDLLGRQSFFERFDFHGWTPWPFLIPSPIWFVGSCVAMVAIAASALADGSWTIDTTAWIAALALVAGFSGGRAQLYLRRKDRWPPWRRAPA